MKRKHTSPEKSNPSKKNPNSQYVDFPVEVVETKPCEQNETVSSIITEERPWKNLELILALQSKELSVKDKKSSVKEKVELAFSFVKEHGKGADKDEEECQAIKISRLVIFLSDWIQSLLISTQKSLQVKGDI